MTSAEEQLDAIARLGAALDARGIDYWLFGGWAVDFWVGEVTREHADVDVAAWLKDKDAIVAALEAAGFRHEPRPDMDEAATRFVRGGVEVEFTFVADDNGVIVIPFAKAPATFSARPLGDERRELRGVSARTIPLALLRDGKSQPREEPEDAAKDLADYEALTRQAARGAWASSGSTAV